MKKEIILILLSIWKACYVSLGIAQTHKRESKPFPTTKSCMWKLSLTIKLGGNAVARWMEYHPRIHIVKQRGKKSRMVFTSSTCSVVNDPPYLDFLRSILEGIYTSSSQYVRALREGSFVLDSKLAGRVDCFEGLRWPAGLGSIINQFLARRKSRLMHKGGSKL